jgi:hypothetical protein
LRLRGRVGRWLDDVLRRFLIAAAEQRCRAAADRDEQEAADHHRHHPAASRDRVLGLAEPDRNAARCRQVRAGGGLARVRVALDLIDHRLGREPDLDGLEVVQQLRHRLVALLGFLRQALEDHRLERGRNVDRRRQLVRRDRVLVQVLGQDAHQVVGVERHGTSGHLVEDHADGVEVGAMVDAGPRALLG